MARKYYLTHNCHLWLNNELLLQNTGLKKITWNPDTILLELSMPLSFPEDKLFEIPFNLGLFIKEFGRVDSLEGAKLVMSFNGCALSNRWVEDATTLFVNENKAVIMFTEFTCKIVEHNG